MYDFRFVQIDLFGQGAGMVVCEVFRKWAVSLLNKLVWFGLETACAKVFRKWAVSLLNKLVWFGLERHVQ